MNLEPDTKAEPKSAALKWVFRVAGVIILMFLILCAVGMFLPDRFSVEQTAEIDAYTEDVYPYLVDMNEFRHWSPWARETGPDDYIVSGAEYGVGQESAWRCDVSGCLPGSQSIIAAQAGEFVQTQLLINGEPMSAVYALRQHEDRSGLTVLVKIDRTLGGFPFVQRFLKSAKTRGMEKRLAMALGELKAQVEDDIAL